MRCTTILCAAMLVIVAVPGGLASHADPTHGTAPHSVSIEPTKMHPVDVSTPHPYPNQATLSWTVEVEDADSLSVHFERYDVNGRESRRGGCYGSQVTLSDADTGETLDTICGNTPGQEDFWTPFYDANRIEITLDTARAWSDHYGFDVYEVAADGALAFTSVPYSEEPRAGGDADADAEPDPFLPTHSSALVYATGEAGYSSTEAHGTGQVGIGKYLDCSTFYCREKSGNRVQLAGGASVGTVTADGEVLLTVEEDEDAPGGYSVTPVVTCDIDGTPCPDPSEAP